MLGLLIALVLANLVILVVVMNTQRVTSPVCGACDASLALTLERRCESCGADLLERGIVAGAVMRPTPRAVLMVLMAVIVFSFSPLLARGAIGWTSALMENGPWSSTQHAVFSNSNPDVPGVAVEIHEWFAGPYLQSGVRDRVEVTVKLVTGSVEPLHLEGDGSATAFDQAKVLQWFSDANVGVDEATMKAVAGMISNIPSSISITTSGEFTSMSGFNETKRASLPPLVTIGVWSLAAAILVLAMVIGGIIVAGKTRRSDGARS